MSATSKMWHRHRAASPMAAPPPPRDDSEPPAADSDNASPLEADAAAFALAVDAASFAADVEHLGSSFATGEDDLPPPLTRLPGTGSPCNDGASLGADDADGMIDLVVHRHELSRRMSADEASFATGEDDLPPPLTRLPWTGSPCDDGASLRADDADGTIDLAVHRRELSRRTARLMRDFRGYIDTLGRVAEGAGVDVAGVAVEARGRGRLWAGRNDRLVAGGASPGGGRSELLRDFGGDRHWRGYARAWLRSRRVRQGLAALVLAAVALVALSTARNARREKNLPNWDQQFAEDLEKEKEKEKEKEEEEEEGEEEALARPAELMAPIEDEVAPEVTTIVRLFHPILYDRGHGWEGSTYDEAVRFCSRRARVLCREEAYCPGGKVPLAIPNGNNIWDLMQENGDLGGQKHWAPLGNVHSWIQIGKVEGRICETYSAPFSGAAGVHSFENTGYLMCCLDPDSIYGSLSTKTMVETTPSASQPSLPSQQAIPPLSSSVVDAAVESARTDFVDGEFEAVYKILHDRIDFNLKPVPHNRFSGWIGHSYSEALEFCNSRESGSTGLCSYKSLCPNGSGVEQPSIRFLDGPLWLPINGKVVDMWVEIHKEGKCKVQTNLAESQEDVTRYVVCCRAEGEESSGMEDSP